MEPPRQLGLLPMECIWCHKQIATCIPLQHITKCDLTANDANLLCRGGGFTSTPKGDCHSGVQEGCVRGSSSLTNLLGSKFDEINRIRISLWIFKLVCIGSVFEEMF